MTHLFDIIHRRSGFLTFDHKGDLLYELWKERFEETPGRLTSKGIMYGEKNACYFFARYCSYAAFAVAIIGGSLGFGVYKGILDSAPSIDDIDATPTGYLTTVLDNQGNEIATLVASGSNRKNVTIDEIPINLQHAFVALEDSRFYEHNGIDLTGIIRAGVTGIASGGHFFPGCQYDHTAAFEEHCVYRVDE